MKAGKSGTAPDAAEGARQHDYEFVRVREAREHTLKNVDVDIPRDARVVFTGCRDRESRRLRSARCRRRRGGTIWSRWRRTRDGCSTRWVSPEVDEIDGNPPAVAL